MVCLTFIKKEKLKINIKVSKIEKTKGKIYLYDFIQQNFDSNFEKLFDSGIIASTFTIWTSGLPMLSLVMPNTVVIYQKP